MKPEHLAEYAELCDRIARLYYGWPFEMLPESGREWVIQLADEEAT